MHQVPGDKYFSLSDLVKQTYTTRESAITTKCGQKLLNIEMFPYLSLY